MLIKSLWARLMRKRIKLESGTNKYFKFDLDRKLNPWLKFEPCFFIWLPKGKIEKTTVYLPFFLFIQFSAIEIRLVSSHAKLVTVTGKKGRCPCSLTEQNWQSSISRQIRHVFNMCMCARGRGRGVGSLNIPLMVSCVLNFRLLHSNILRSFSQFRSLTVPFSGMHCLPPFALTPPLSLQS